MTIRNVHLPTADVWLANILAVTLTLSDVQTVLTIISLCIAIGYSIWRWVKEYKSKK